MTRLLSKKNKMFISAEEIGQGKVIVVLSSIGGIKNRLLEDIINNAIEFEKLLEKKVIPEDLLCPIKKELIDIPVITEFGNTYDKEALAHWCMTLGINKDPLTNLENESFFVLLVLL